MSNDGVECSGSGFSDGGNNWISDNTCTGVAGASSLNLGPLAANGGPTLTHALEPGSVAIDAAGNCVTDFGISTDQRGVARPQGTACDIGAYEVATDINEIIDFFDTELENGGLVGLSPAKNKNGKGKGKTITINLQKRAPMLLETS